ncbi:histidinol-phosphate transaminase [Streptomyces angustmyceticus]|uniref:histidinol-phosphate transaminase n=1 Tax=Streptomyces angustmyceticus TaxID=285578 RepID=UPI0021B05863|nr:histidinol-phosphate transaminase [Streptomyces angustmyceticus]
MPHTTDIPAPLLRLALNETPYPPLPTVRDALTDSLAEVNRYPQFYADDLTEAVSAWRGVPVESVVVGSGSVGVALQTLQAYIQEPGDQVLYAWRAFDAYPIIADMAGADRVEVPLTAGGEQDLTRMSAAVTDRTRVVILCNPHNPTGTTIGRAAMDAFLASLPDGVLVILDEAYTEFARDADDLPQGLDLVRAGHPVMSLRTFSKAYGLAGLRIGYGIAAPEVVKRVRPTSVPYSISELARAAVTASIGAEQDLDRRIRTISTERSRVQAALRAQGWRVLESRANFVWLDEPLRAGAFHTACADRGAQVRLYPDEGIRLTIGTAEANDVVLAAAGELAAG